MTHGMKYQEGGNWFLTTRRGVVVAVFPSESELDAWWSAFQTSQGKEPKPLGIGLFRRVWPSPNRQRKAYRPSGDRSPYTGSTYNGKAWSSEYNMPEAD
jgi:hypothetical protein